MLTFATPGRPTTMSRIRIAASSIGSVRIGERAQAGEHRLGLIERERDIVLDVDRLRGELVARHRVGRIVRRAPAEQQHDDAGRDHEQRQDHEHAYRRREQAAKPLGRRRRREAALGLIHRVQCSRSGQLFGASGHWCARLAVRFVRACRTSFASRSPSWRSSASASASRRSSPPVATARLLGFPAGARHTRPRG